MRINKNILKEITKGKLFEQTPNPNDLGGTPNPADLGSGGTPNPADLGGGGTPNPADLGGGGTPNPADLGNGNSGGNSGGNSTITTNFPQCIKGLGGQSKGSDTWEVTTGGITYIFKIDNTFTANNGVKGTWSCSGNNTVQTASTVNNVVQDWTTGFPDCVKNLTKRDDFKMYIGTTNYNGRNYTVFYSNTARQNGFAAYLRPEGVTENNQDISAAYYCDNGVPKVYDPMTSTNAQSGTGNLNSEQKESYDLVMDYNKALGIKLFRSGNRLNSADLEAATGVVVEYINGKYRSIGFGYYAKLLESLEEFYTSMGDRYVNDLTFVKKQMESVTTAITSASNQQIKAAGLTEWNPTTRPSELNIGSYTKTNYTAAPFTIPFELYRLTGQMMSSASQTQIDTQLQNYMKANTLTKEYCERTLNEMLDCIQYDRGGFLKKKPTEVTSCEDFGQEIMQPKKQVVANCRRAGLLNNFGKELDALGDEGLDPRYKIRFAVRKSTEQPFPGVTVK
jgi:hypothetical protein